MARPKSTEGGEPYSIRIPDALMSDIEAVAKKFDWSEQQVMREAMKLGLADWKLCDYKPQAIVARYAAAQREHEVALLAEQAKGGYVVNAEATAPASDSTDALLRAAAKSFLSAPAVDPVSPPPSSPRVRRK